jgi:hypothetical protein
MQLEHQYDELEHSNADLGDTILTHRLSAIDGVLFDG